MPLQTSGTLAVPANATSITVTGAFVLPYQVTLSTSWVTTASVSAKTLTSFLVTFGTPAPAGGGTLDWSVTNAFISVPSASSGTLRDLIIRAFKLSHVIGAGETLTDEEMNDTFDLANGLIDQANLDKLFALYQTETIFTMQANKQVYTIGPSGADVTSVRPMEILFAFSRRANQVDLPMLVTHQKIDFDRIQKKNIAIAGWEQVLWYQPAYPNGILNFYMMPLDTQSEVHLTYNAQFSAFVTVNDAVSLPPLYSTWLKYKLAERLCPGYGVTWSNENKNILTEVEATLKRNNIKPFPIAVGEMAELTRASGEKYNVYADTTTRN